MNFQRIDDKVTNVMTNNIVATIVAVFITLYAATLTKYKLPDFIQKLFNNTFFRLLIIALIAYRATQDPQSAILVAVAFVLIMNILNKQEIDEGFRQIENFAQMQSNGQHF
jgi:hypothetical protein